MRKIALMGLLIAYSSQIFAYIDPGIISAAYQSLYAIVMAGLAFFIFTPWNYIKRFVSRLFKGKQIEDTTTKKKNTSH